MYFCNEFVFNSQLYFYESPQYAPTTNWVKCGHSYIL